MSKKFQLIALVALLVGGSALGAVFANQSSQNLLASAAWNYDVYRVERLVLNADLEGPYSFGDEVFFAKESAQCGAECEWLDVSFVRNGSVTSVTDVRSDVMNLAWHAPHEGSFLYLTKDGASEGDWMNLREYDPSTGQISEVISLPKQENRFELISYVIDGDMHFTSTIQPEKNGNVKAILNVSNPDEEFSRDFAPRMNVNWREIADVQDGYVLSKVQFAGGAKQLFVLNPTDRTVVEVPNTWTQEPGDIVAAHFLADGRVAYFQNFVHTTWDPHGSAAPVKHGGAFLNWYDSLENSVQVVGERMAWIDAENQLHFSDATGVHRVGRADLGSFTLTKDSLFYSQNGVGKQYQFGSGARFEYAFRVTDVLDNVAVGLDDQGDVWYLNLTSGKELKIGFGSDAYLTDRNHAVWRGVDGNIYQATFSDLLDMDFERTRAVRAEGSSRVYMIQDNQRYLIETPDVFFTWFDSWEQVEDISSAHLNLYAYAGEAKFMPGTRVKMVNNPRVYTVGTDGKLHWIATESVAHELYGPQWNKNILEVQPNQLADYQLGATVQVSRDVKSI